MIELAYCVRVTKRTFVDWEKRKQAAARKSSDGVCNSKTGVTEIASFSTRSARIFPVKVECPVTHAIQMLVGVMFAWHQMLIVKRYSRGVSFKVFIVVIESVKYKRIW